MPHPEREHELMIEVARLQKRVDDGDATARILVKDVRAWSDTCDKLRSERDALRSENGRLRSALMLIVAPIPYSENAMTVVQNTARAALASGGDRG